MDHQLSLRWCLWPPEKHFPTLQGPTRLSGSDGDESACNAGDQGSIPGLSRFPGEGNGNPISILAWRISWTEEPAGLQSMGS